MNVRRFTARSSRDALNLVKQAFGQEAVVLSTRPCAEGVEVLAMAPDSVPAYEGPALGARPAAPPPARAPEPPPESSPSQDAERLAMSTLSFQDYVRERMLRRRRAELQGQAAPAAAPAAPAQPPAARLLAAPATAPGAGAPPVAAAQAAARFGAAVRQLDEWGMPRPAAEGSVPDTRAAEPRAAESGPHEPTARTAASVAAQHLQRADSEADTGFRLAVETGTSNAAMPSELVRELRDMREMIEQRFGALAYLEKLKREPRSALLLQRLLEAGFSPVLARRLADALPAEADPPAWATAVLERNLLTGERESALEDTGGVFALIGPTGVGKTTSTAKLAAAFATRHGAANLGLVTLDAYRVAAHEQLRAYGKILGVPVHSAQSWAELNSLVETMGQKRLVLIDSTGMGQRDTRLPEQLNLLNHPRIRRVLLLNAAAQAETLDDVARAYRGQAAGATPLAGAILTKTDEAARLGPALDVLTRHALELLCVTNGQRVPEDLQAAAAPALVQRALKAGTDAQFALSAEEAQARALHAPLV